MEQSPLRDNSLSPSTFTKKIKNIIFGHSQRRSWQTSSDATLIFLWFCLDFCTFSRTCFSVLCVDCTMYCSGDYCGGYLANDVYYSPGLYRIVLCCFVAHKYSLFRPPDIVVGGLKLYRDFSIFFFFYFLFYSSAIPAELAKWYSTKAGHVLGSECDLKMHVRNLKLRLV